MGPLKGKKLLDIGAGLGESSVYFALHCAEVTTTDVSSEMVKTAVGLGERYGVTSGGLGGRRVECPGGHLRLGVHLQHDSSRGRARAPVRPNPAGVEARRSLLFLRVENDLGRDSRPTLNSPRLTAFALSPQAPAYR